MRSQRPKPLHHLCGRPMVLHVIDAVSGLKVDRVVVVVGHEAAWVVKSLTERSPAGLAIEFVEQPVQLGTGHAVSVALGTFDVPDDDEVTRHCCGRTRSRRLSTRTSRGATR